MLKALLAFLLLSAPALSKPPQGKKQPSARAANKSQARAADNRRNAAVPTPSTAEPSKETDAPEPAAKSEAQCHAAVAKCLDKKVIEAAAASAELYDDYNDMLADVYNGADLPFKCAYLDESKSIYSKYYYGFSMLSTSARHKIEPDSIEYYDYLKKNALAVASRTLGPEQIDDAVLRMAGINDRPQNKPVIQLPEAPVKVASLDPDAKFQTDAKYCSAPATNKSAEGCDEQVLSTGAREWLKSGSITAEKSCADYDAFLADKRRQAKDSASESINSVKTKLADFIREYNQVQDAERKLRFAK
ncbi:MAG: hypothetical protein LBL52_03555 [Rickettsiales bacterium]|jgi:hypothetical protein|nr:hypothetical protein [Rickettsiales bacterium]